MDTEDIDIISIEENVPIVEERYKELSGLYLTKEQVVIELTNLLLETYQHDVHSHVDTYKTILASTSKSNETFGIGFGIQPVVEYDRIEYFYDQDFVVDPVFEKEKQVKYVGFVSFLNQLRNLMKSKESCQQTNKRLDKLFTPFVSTGEPYPKTTDALRRNAQGDYINVRVLQEDIVKHDGYMTRKKTDNEFSTFDWELYCSEIGSLQEGDRVKLMFNDYILDATKKKPVYDLKGIVSKIVDDEIHIKCDNDMKFKYEHEKPKFFVYPVDTKNHMFSKRDLLTTAVYLKNTPEKYVLPSTLTEVIYITMYVIQRDARNFHDIYNAIKNILNHDISLHQSAGDVLRNIFDTKYPKLVKVTGTSKYSPLSKDQPTYLFRSMQIPEVLEGSFGDSDFQRYKILKNHLETEQMHILGILQKFIEKHSQGVSVEKLEQSLRSIKHVKPEPEKSCYKDEKRVVIAKQYVSVSDLQKDHGKKIYFDEDLDTTDYKKNVETLRMELTRNPKMTPKDVEFEVDTVVKGKRRIRENDHCILKPDTLYVWKRVDGRGMWIKKRKYPFTVCANDLDATFECVYDMYDQVCKSLKNVQDNIQYQKYSQKTTIIKDLIDFVMRKDEFIQLVKTDIASLHNRLISTNEIFIKAHIDSSAHEEDVDAYFAEGDDNMHTEGLLNYEDQNQYAYMPEERDHSAPSNRNMAYDFARMITGFMDLKIRDEDVLYISNKVDGQTKKAQAIEEGLQKERARLNKSIDRVKYTDNATYRTAVDKLVNDKLTAYTEKAYADLYFEFAVQTIALLSLVIMSKYPRILLNSIYPSCIKYMSYQGHPFTEANTSRSINKYICCVVKGITSGGDTKYDKIQSKSLDDFTKDIMKRMDNILENDANMRLRVEANKDKLQAAISKPVEKKMKRMFPGFRPAAEIFKTKDYKTKHPLALALRNMNNVIKKAKHLKISTGNIPQLLNACCLERLDNVHSYYDYYADEHPTKSIKPSSKVMMRRNNVVFSIIKALKKEDDISALKPIHQTTMPARIYETHGHSMSQEDIIKDCTGIEVNDESMWDDIIFPKTLETYDIIKRFIEKTYDACDPHILDNFRPILIMITEIGDADTVRQCIYQHITVTMSREIGKIVNKKIEDDDWRFSLVVRGDVDLSKWMVLLTDDLKKLWFEDDVTKNISILSYVYVQLLYKMICVMVAPQSRQSGQSGQSGESELSMTLLGSSEEKKGLISLVSRFVYENIKNLLECISTNDVDAGVVRQKVEELREIRKQELINMYKIDDEERQLQMNLRKIGVDTWYDVGESIEQDVYVDMMEPNPGNISITKHNNALQEAENYNMSGYPGENGDADEINEDYASAYMFSPDI